MAIGLLGVEVDSHVHGLLHVLGVVEAVHSHISSWGCTQPYLRYHSWYEACIYIPCHAIYGEQSFASHSVSQASATAVACVCVS
jgi:hypothetical protein